MHAPLTVTLSLAVVCALSAPATAAEVAGEFVFSGHTWIKKDSAGRAIGPGPNRFSSADSNVWVDEDGRLHLRITQGPNGWHCAEVFLKTPLGYGTYTIETASPLESLDPNAVFGFFTWSNKAAFNHQELDIEFSRWGHVDDPLNAQFAVPPTPPRGPHGNVFRWKHSDAADHVGVYEIKWGPGQAHFSATPAGGPTVKWEYPNAAGVPPALDAVIDLNLWLFRSTAPLTQQPVEVIINKFSFQPAGH